MKVFRSIESKSTSWETVEITPPPPLQQKKQQNLYHGWSTYPPLPFFWGGALFLRWGYWFGRGKLTSPTAWKKPSSTISNNRLHPLGDLRIRPLKRSMQHCHCDRWSAQKNHWVWNSHDLYVKHISQKSNYTNYTSSNKNKPCFWQTHNSDLQTSVLHIASNRIGWFQFMPWQRNTADSESAIKSGDCLWAPIILHVHKERWAVLVLLCYSQIRTFWNNQQQKNGCKTAMKLHQTVEQHTHEIWPTSVFFDWENTWWSWNLDLQLRKGASVVPAVRSRDLWWSPTEPRFETG